jgi:DivIVA domain-containing protein
MSLDRQTVERRDFPIGRRGYEPEAVDAHLARLADEIDALKRSGTQHRAPESIAAVASTQVAAIVQAAETTAADIERLARDEADRIRRDAESDATSTRDDAIERSRSQVGRVSEATALMLQRVDAMESELTALTESLRTGASRLQADLTLLEGNMGELYGASGQRVEVVEVVEVVAEPAREVPAPPAPAAPQAAAPAQAAAPDAQEAPVRGAEEEIAPEADAPEQRAEAAAAATGGAGSDEDVEGARLIALNMALNGTPREETDRYLAENFDLSDRSGLLDEVYASVE